MAPFIYGRRYQNYYKRRPYYRRIQYRRRRPRKTFRRKTYRKYRVRRRFFKKLYRKKLKKITLKQYQPVKIRKCKIKGYLQLFEAGMGRFENNFAMYKESYTPDFEPGGGGWSIQQLGLGILYAQNNMFLNWWTVSNKGLPLVRYNGVKITLFRQQQTDYIFWWDIEGPIPITKYTYASLHPIKLLLEKKKVVVPSLATQPLKRKPFKTKWITPPKEMINKWYFQSHISDFPLITFGATAVSLQSMFQPRNAINNSITLHSVNTRFFQNPKFQYPGTSTQGYIPKEGTYIYGLHNGDPELSKNLISEVVYLGNSMINDPGDTRGTRMLSEYGPPHWGNVFFHKYLDGDMRSFITSSPYTDFLSDTNKTKTIKDTKISYTAKTEPYIYKLRYNPDKDKGTGNSVYWVSNLDARNWDPPDDPDLRIDNFPLWLSLWGWEDYTRKLGKLRNLNQDWMLCIRTKYFSETLPTYCLVSQQFVDGEGPYNVGHDQLSLQDRAHWYPRFRYQKEAVSAICMTGPGVCKSEYQKSIQAHLKYDFRFKWGGNPPTMENIFDPNSQPTYANPDNIRLLNEITSPTESITNYLYNWDIRRDFLTQTAAERITKSTETDYSLFTDGMQSSTDVQIQKATTQEKTTQEKTQEEILQQLSNILQYNQQLRLRLQLLKSQIEHTS
nr:MAG: ORF1 [TTV-like mini virus]